MQNALPRTLSIAIALWVALVFTPKTMALPSYITFPSNIDWVMKDSEHFAAIYRRGNEKLANRGLVAAERAYKLLTPFLPQAPEKTWVVFSDFHDSINGYALPFPYPHMVIFAAPPDSDEELSSLEDWLDTVVLHEFTHILHLYPANGFWSVMRAVFGSWVAPNGLMPMHFHEGLAVLTETEKTKGGRGRSPYFSMLRRSAVDAKVWGTPSFFSLDQMDGATSRYPHGASAYFFGYHMYKELLKRKGEKAIGDLVYEYSGGLPYFLNTQLEDVYGTDYPTLWANIFDSGRAEALKEIQEIQSQPLPPLHWLTESRFTKSDTALSPDSKWIAYRRWTPTDGAALLVLDWENKKVVRTIDELSGDAQGMCWLNLDKKLFLIYIDTKTTFNHQVKVLKAYNWETRESQTLSGEKYDISHVHRLGCTDEDNQLAVYQENAGRGSITAIKLFLTADKITAKKEKSWELPTGSWVTSLLPTKEFIWVGLRHDQGKIQTELLKWKDSIPENVYELDTHLFGFRPGTGNADFYAVASIDNRNEVWHVDTAKKSAVKTIPLLSGTNSFERAGSKFILSAYRHGGYDIATAEAGAKSSKVKLKKTAAEREVAAEEAKAATAQAEASIGAETDYSPWRTLLPKTWIPSFLFVPDGVQFGLWIPGFDISQKHFYNITAGYDTRGLPFGDINYTYRFGNSYSMVSSLYYQPSYIQQTRDFLKQWGATLALAGSIDPIPPQITLGVVYKRLEDAAPFVVGSHSVGLQLGLSYSVGIKKRPLSISPIKGTTLGLIHTQYLQALGSSDNFFTTTLSADQYLENPFWREHVLFFALRGGYTEGTSIFNSYFQGGGEILFSQARGIYLNRGFYPGSFLGRRIANLTTEYRFPIANVERGINLLPVKLKTVHGALTFDTTTLDGGPQSRAPQDIFRVYYASAGGELRSEWNFGFYLPATVRAGLYHGFGPYGENLYFSLGVEATL